MYVEISVAVLVNSHKISENIGNNGKILLLNLYNRHISFFGGLQKCAFLCAAPPNRLRPEGAGGQPVDKPHIPPGIWGKIISSRKNRTKNEAKSQSTQAIPPVYCVFFQVHGSKFKPDPFRDLSQAS